MAEKIMDKAIAPTLDPNIGSSEQLSKPPTRQARIAVFGTFGTGNLGNECTLQSMLHNIRRWLAPADIICVCSGPDATTATCDVPSFPIRYAVSIRKALGISQQRNNRLLGWLRSCIRAAMAPNRWYKAFKILKGRDMLIVTGLGMLGDFGIRPFGLHYDILGWSVLAKIRRCKVYFVSVGVGPLQHPVSRLFVRTALRLGEYRSYRDTFSRRYLETINFDTTRDNVYPDLAFSFPKDRLDAANVPTRTGIIGVGLMNYYNRLGRPESSPNNYHKYVCDITALIAGLAKQRRTVRLLIGDTRWDQDVRTDVRKALEKSGIHSSDGLIIDEPAATVDDILLQLGSVDVVVASRFHNLLLAAILGKPIIALSYHDKIPALMEELGVREFCHDIEDFSSEEVSAQVLKLEDPTIRARFLHRVQARVIDYREMLDDQYRQMFAPFVKTCATDAISNGQWQ